MPENGTAAGVKTLVKGEYLLGLLTVIALGIGGWTLVRVTEVGEAVAAMQANRWTSHDQVRFAAELAMTNKATTNQLSELMVRLTKIEVTHEQIVTLLNRLAEQKQ